MHGNTKCNGRTVPHRSDSQKVTFMTLSILCSYFKQFATCFSCSRNNRILTCKSYNMPNNFFPDHLILIGIFYILSISDGAFSNNKCYTLTFCKFYSKCSHNRIYFFFCSFFAYNEILNIHIFEKFYRYFSLVYMLWFIIYTRFSTPANNKNHRHRIYFII